MESLERFAAADLSASKVMVQRYLERGFVKPALARLQRCLTTGSTDHEVLELLAEAFERLGKEDKARFVREMVSRRQAELEGWDEDGPTALYIDIRDFDRRPPREDEPTLQWDRRRTDGADDS